MQHQSKALHSKVPEGGSLCSGLKAAQTRRFPNVTPGDPAGPGSHAQGARKARADSSATLRPFEVNKPLPGVELVLPPRGQLAIPLSACCSGVDLESSSSSSSSPLSAPAR